MCHPAASAIEVPGGVRAGGGDIANQLVEGREHLAQVRGLHRPVVHLHIDIGGVVAAPRRPHVLVPDALQVRRGTRCARGGDQQVPTKLEVQSLEAGIRGAACIRFQSPVRREPAGIGLGRIERKRDAIEEAAIVREVRGAQLPKVVRRRSFQRADILLTFILALAEGAAIESVEAGRRGNEQHHFVGVPDRQLP